MQQLTYFSLNNPQHAMPQAVPGTNVIYVPDLKPVVEAYGLHTAGVQIADYQPPPAAPGFNQNNQQGPVMNSPQPQSQNPQYQQYPLAQNAPPQNQSLQGDQQTQTQLPQQVLQAAVGLDTSCIHALITDKSVAYEPAYQHDDQHRHGRIGG